MAWTNADLLGQLEMCQEIVSRGFTEKWEVNSLSKKMQSLSKNIEESRYELSRRPHSSSEMNTLNEMNQRLSNIQDAFSAAAAHLFDAYYEKLNTKVSSSSKTVKKNSACTYRNKRFEIIYDRPLRGGYNSRRGFHSLHEVQARFEFIEEKSPYRHFTGRSPGWGVANLLAGTFIVPAIFDIIRVLRVDKIGYPLVYAVGFEDKERWGVFDVKASALVSYVVFTKIDILKDSFFEYEVEDPWKNNKYIINVEKRTSDFLA